MAIWNRIRSFFGGSPQPDARRIMESEKPLSLEQAAEFDALRRGAIAELLRQYSVPDAAEGLALLQATIRDGTFHETQDMRPLGILWGDLLAQAIGAHWVTVEWEGVRLPALNIPRTSVFAFPIANLEKRRDRKEHVDFPFFFANMIEELRRMSQSPEYRRQ